jgi:guanosine-3',5'-bis(diphosphate) 3'-pyrophosphohydrolase
MLEDYLEPDQIAEVYRAYLFGAEAHDGQSRASGEPYIYHPVAVAHILAEMRMDTKSLVAALLHDVIEDTPTAKEQLIRLFGEEVAELVDGVSKLTHIEFESRIEAQAENFRKMILAMTRDIRVILVKLADRLHNMRTLGAMRPDKRRRIARETLEIYAPIANRLGMNRVRLELEELGFAALYPLRYRVIAERMKKSRGNRKEIVSKIENSITERMKQEGLSGQVIGREKHLYGIYNKMREKQLPFNEIMDVYAFRIIVESVDMCYRVLGAVHNLYKPVPGRFKDYIAIPKANGYQSLHTVLFSPYGVPIEVQIRTEDMHRVAEAGIAAHWLYKSGDDSGNSAQVRARQWLLDLLEIQQHAGNSMEFLENVKVDLFPDEVYVFTPKGMIMELPRGATAVDFAYAVHTDVGNQCVAVKIDRRLMPLRSELHNGQTVEVITAAGARPNPAWLNFVHTAKARANIRNYLKNLQYDEAVSLGQRLLNKMLDQYGTSLQDIPEQNLYQACETFKVKSFDKLLMEIGLGNRMPMMVARALIQQGEDDKPGKELKSSASESKPLAIKGTEGTVVTYAKCCRPIPGDKILGFVSAGRGVVIHVEGCKNVADFRNKPEKWIDVEWEKDVAGEFPVELRLLVVNQRGVLATIAAAISDLDANIENVVMDERDGQHSQLTFTVGLKDRKHLARIIKRLRSLPNVVRIGRVQK